MKAVENWLDFILLTEGQSSLSGWDGALPIHQEQVKKLQISDQKLIVKLKDMRGRQDCCARVWRARTLCCQSGV